MAPWQRRDLASLRGGDGEVLETLSRQSLFEIGVTSVNDLLGTYAGQNSDLGVFSAGAELNRVDGMIKEVHRAVSISPDARALAERIDAAG